jgi:hypothetical protein
VEEGGIRTGRRLNGDQNHQGRHCTCRTGSLVFNASPYTATGRHGGCDSRLMSIGWYYTKRTPKFPPYDFA